MRTFGETLRQARLDRGASLAEAEEETRIRRRYLEALEAEDYANLPPPVYTRGFVRTYAEWLGLNPQAMSDLYNPPSKRTTVQTPIRSAVPHIAIPRELPVRPVLYALGAIVVLIGVWYLWGQYQAVQDALRASEGLPSRSATPPAPVRGPTINPIAVPSPSPSPSVAPSLPPTPIPSPTAVLDGILIEIRVTSTVYVEAAADGRQVIAETLPAGTQRTLELAKDVVVLRASNGAALEITVNGQRQEAEAAAGPVELTWRR